MFNLVLLDDKAATPIDDERQVPFVGFQISSSAIICDFRE
jgi:hypothetical protein